MLSRLSLAALNGSLRNFPRASFSSLETKIADVLKTELKPTALIVKDVSGGCGAMFDIAIESPLFTGKSLVNQHKMVTQAIRNEIKDMHGLTLKTKASSSS